MSNRKASQVHTPNRAVLLTARVLLAAAMAVSIYLAWVSFAGGGVAGCGLDSGCDKVLQSRWSKWFGIPVSVPAALLYGLMLAASLRLTPGATPTQQRQSWSLLIPACWAVAGAVLWFVSLQFFVVKAVCPYCMAAHASGLLAAIMLLLSAPVREAPEKPWQREKEVYVIPRQAGFAVLMGLTGVAVLVGGQLAYRSKQFKVTTVAGGSLQEAQRIFEIYEGRFKFNMNEVPLIGAPSAPKAMVSLFDYTCHHCKVMHGILKEAHRRFSNELAIVSLPMPLDNSCNYTVRMTPAAHSNACEYARLGLAVWHANRAAHPQFDDWLFEPEHPPELPAARQRAAELAGPKLEASLTNEWVNQYLQLGISIYATNYYFARQGSMPQLIVGTNLIAGTVNPDELFARLDTQLGLKSTNHVLKTQ